MSGSAVHCHSGAALAAQRRASTGWCAGCAARWAACADRPPLLQVILVVPWLAVSDQALIFPNARTFEEPAEQEACMREWIRKRTGLSPDFEIVWYPGTLPHVAAAARSREGVSRVPPRTAATWHTCFAIAH